MHRNIQHHCKGSAKSNIYDAVSDRDGIVLSESVCDSCLWYVENLMKAALECI